jgi:hypothetical protein
VCLLHRFILHGIHIHPAPHLIIGAGADGGLDGASDGQTVLFRYKAVTLLWRRVELGVEDGVGEEDGHEARGDDPRAHHARGLGVVRRDQAEPAAWNTIIIVIIVNIIIITTIVIIGSIVGEEDGQEARGDDRRPHRARGLGVVRRDQAEPASWNTIDIIIIIIVIINIIMISSSSSTIIIIIIIITILPLTSRASP